MFLREIDREDVHLPVAWGIVALSGSPVVAAASWRGSATPSETAVARKARSSGALRAIPRIRSSKA